MKRLAVVTLLIAAFFGGSWFDGHNAARSTNVSVCKPVRVAFPSVRRSSDLREQLRRIIKHRR